MVQFSPTHSAKGNEMGDRAQVAIKSGNEKVYLYAHWSGTEVYKAAAQAVIDAPDRHNDPEYFARVVFCRMVSKNDLLETTGFGIGLHKHGDTEHPIPIFDCDSGKVRFEKASSYDEVPAGDMTFKQFAVDALAGKFDEL